MRVMKAYIYASPAGAAAHVLSQCFSDFAELYRHGFLRDDSIVWANAEAPDASFWALTDRSQYVYVHRATEPGYVRLTSGGCAGGAVSMARSRNSRWTSTRATSQASPTNI